MPVLFTAQEWNPATQRMQDWLVLRLRQTYPLLPDHGGKMMVILDGLDEMAGELEPVALQALSKPRPGWWSWPVPPRWHPPPRSGASWKARRRSSCTRRPEDCR